MGNLAFFISEENTFKKIAKELGIIKRQTSDEGVAYARYPLVYLVEAADDICYEIMDIEDSHKLKLLSFEETSELLLGFFDEDTKRSIRNRIIEEGVPIRTNKWYIFVLVPLDYWRHYALMCLLKTKSLYLMVHLKVR